MALTTGNQYLASEFNALKARVKAEMQRRQYNGSLTAYGDTPYDYTVTPAAGNTVLIEHMNKLVQPLNAINTTGMTTVKAGDPIQAIQALNTFLTTAEQYPLTSSTTDCKSSCTGLCTTGCGSTCTGCTGGCEGTCNTTCTGTCSGGCSGCGGNCTGGCSGKCYGCYGTCSSSCAKGCASKCSSGNVCKGSCKSTCGGNCKGGVNAGTS